MVLFFSCFVSLFELLLRIFCLFFVHTHTDRTGGERRECVTYFCLYHHGNGKIKKKFKSKQMNRNWMTHSQSISLSLWHTHRHTHRYTNIRWAQHDQWFQHDYNHLPLAPTKSGWFFFSSFLTLICPSQSKRSLSPSLFLSFFLSFFLSLSVMTLDIETCDFGLIEEGWK